jgi:hypothetical protein
MRDGELTDAPGDRATGTVIIGLCNGGPYNGRPIAHHEPSLMVCLEQTWRGHYVPIVGATLAIAQDRPEIHFGAYVWDDGTRRWAWHAEAAISIRSADKTL